jgi:hypothetical protein
VSVLYRQTVVGLGWEIRTVNKVGATYCASVCAYEAVVAQSWSVPFLQRSTSARSAMSSAAAAAATATGDRVESLSFLENPEVVWLQSKVVSFKIGTKLAPGSVWVSSNTSTIRVKE